MYSCRWKMLSFFNLQLRWQDAIEKVKKFTSIDLSRYQHIQNHQEFISSLGIPGFGFYISHFFKEFKCHSLTGLKQLKPLQKNWHTSLLPNFQCISVPGNSASMEETPLSRFNYVKTSLWTAEILYRRILTMIQKMGTTSVYQRCHITPHRVPYTAVSMLWVNSTCRIWLYRIWNIWMQIVQLYCWKFDHVIPYSGKLWRSLNFVSHPNALVNF